MEHQLFILIITFILAEFILSRTLDYLNYKSMSPSIPEPMQGHIDEEKYAQSQLYYKARLKLSIVSSTLSLAGILLFLYFGGFAWLDITIREYTAHPILMTLGFFGALGIVSEIASIPLSVYGVFVIEEKFGFNKMTAGMYIIDKIKGYALTVVVGGAIVALIVWIYMLSAAWFWLIAWATISCITIFISMFYTSLLVPVFNKLTPLEDGSLRQAITDYAKKVDFPLSRIMVVDGSKRSTKANAYFSGLGSRKTIVLYDTLIENHEEEEIVAVLAHEVGHYKKKHITKGMIISTLQMGVIFFILGWALQSPVLPGVLGVTEGSFHISIVVFSFLYSPVSMILSIFANLYSRKNEYEADTYARDTYSGKPLVNALRRLSVDSLSNLTPHPAYVFMHYSHPPLLKRLAALA